MSSRRGRAMRNATADILLRYAPFAAAANPRGRYVHSGMLIIEVREEAAVRRQPNARGGLLLHATCSFAGIALCIALSPLC